MNNSTLGLIILTLALLQGCSSVINATRETPIDEDHTVRSIGEVIDDEVIETKALVNFRKADSGLDEANIIVVSYNGTVLLAGQVSNDSLRQKAEEVVRKIKEVKIVHNQLATVEASTFGMSVSDTWITTRLKTKLLTDSTINGGGIKVVTEHGTVYLMGLVTRTTASKAADLARNTSGVESVVKIFEYID